MVEEVYGLIRKYAGLISELEPPLTGDPKIIYKREDRVYMTVGGADLSDLKIEDIQDVTSLRGDELPAVEALKELKGRTAMILGVPAYTGILLESHHELPASLDDMAQIVGPKIEIVEKDPKHIAKALKKALCVMVGSSALISSGRTLYEAFIALQVAEKAAEVTLKAQVTGGAKPLGWRLSSFMHRKYLKSYSAEENKNQDAVEQSAGLGVDTQEAAEGPEEGKPEAVTEESEAEGGITDLVEERFREELVLYGRLLVEKGLVQGTWGNLSVRLDENSMLITPSGADYARLRARDMVKVDIKTLKSEEGARPSTEKSMHAGIYRTYPEARAVIHTHSRDASIFAASEMPLQVEDMGKIAKLGEIINVSRYAIAGTNKITKNTIKAIGDAPGCVISHHGLVAYGTDLKDAFDNAAMIEAAATEYVNKRWEK